MLRNFFLFIAPIFLSLLLHLYVFKLDLVGVHVWRQAQTQTVIYNFSSSDNCILHPQRFDLTTGTTTLLYEFPMYQWLIAQVNNVLGYSVMHTRVVTFLFFIFFLWGFYKLTRDVFKREISLITNALICFSPLLYYYCVNPLPDILAIACSVWSLYFFFCFLNTARNKHFILFCFFLMWAALIKLPYVLFGGVFVLYQFNLWKQNKRNKLFKYSLILILFLIPSVVWYAYAIPTWKGNGVTEGMINNETSYAKLLEYLVETLVSDVPEMLTNYASCLFLVAGIILFFRNIKCLNHKHSYFVFLFFLFSAYFLFELNMIENKHAYYLMPFLILIFLVIAVGVNYFYKSKYKIIVFVIVCLVPFTAWLRINPRWDLQDPGFPKDYLVEQKAINAAFPKDASCIIDSDNSRFIALYYLKRNGYSLLQGEITNALVKQLYQKGAHYLVTQNFNVAQLSDIKTELVFSKDLKIYKLSLK